MRLLIPLMIVAGAASCAPTLPFECEENIQCGEGSCVDGYCVVNMPAIESFAADRLKVAPGQRVVLTAKYTNGSGTIDQTVGAITSGGSVTVVPARTTTYVLTVANSSWPPAFASIKVDVIPPPVVESFTAAPAVVTAGKSVTLRAEYSGGEGVLDGPHGALPSGQDVILEPAATSVYKLIVTGETGAKVIKSVTVTVVPPPSIRSFTVDDPAIVSGATAVLTPVFEGGLGAIDGVSAVESGLAVRVAPTATTNYLLRVTNAAGDSDTERITVVVHPAMAITSFTATPSVSYTAQPVMLRATFTGGAGTVDNVTGSNVMTSSTDRTVNPNATTVYSFTLTSPAGDTLTAAASVTVHTAPARITSFTATESVTDFGGQSTLSWVLTGVPVNVLLNGFPVAGNSFIAHPVRRASYTLFAGNPIGSETRTLSVAARGLDLLAGSTGGPGYLDHAGSEARFNGPTHLDTVALRDAFDGSTDVHVFIADTLNHVIRYAKLNERTSAWDVGTFAGRPGEAGTDAAGDGVSDSRFKMKFKNPAGIAVAPDGSVYIADTGNHTIRRIFRDGTDPGSGKPEIWGGVATQPGSNDGTGSGAKFNFPNDVALLYESDGSTSVIVADTGNCVLRKITRQKVVTTLTATALNCALGVAVAGSDIYFTSGNLVRRLSGSTVTTIAGSTTGTFTYPWGLTARGGVLWVADREGHRIRAINLGNTNVTTWAGPNTPAQGGDDGSSADARFSFPSGVAVDGGGNLFVADGNSAGGNHTIRRIAGGTVSTIASMTSAGAIDSNDGELARFRSPADAAVSSSGDTFVADAANHAIRKITPDRVVTRFAGSYTSSGVCPTAFNSPSAIAVSSSGDLYVADAGAHVICTVSGTGTVQFLAGSSSGAAGNVPTGTSSATFSAARFNRPTGIVVASGGDVYIADASNFVIRRISGTSVTNFAGTAGTSGFAIGAMGTGRFNSLSQIAISGSTLYVLDTHCIRTVNLGASTGSISAYAGSCSTTGAGSAGGALSSARFNAPTDLVFHGNDLYIADKGNQIIRRIRSSDVSTVVGAAGVSGVVLGRLPGGIFAPSSVAATAAGDLILLSGNAVLQATAP